MNLQNVTGFIQVLVSLIQAISWPLLVLVILAYLRAPLRKFIENVGEFTFKAGPSGLEATAKKQLEAAVSLGAASAKLEDSVGGESGFGSNVRQITEAVSQAITPRAVRRLADASVLWVDDRPENNVYERRSMEGLGIRFVLSTTTEDALQKLTQGHYDVIISDMGRPPDETAGYALLDELKRRKIEIPFIIYAGSNLPQHKAEARARSAYGSTNRPQELFQLVVSAIMGD